MSKYIVCVFENGKAANEGVRAVRQLDDEGSITVYEGAIISKDEKGAIRIEDSKVDGPIGTLTGMLLGGLIGILGGPVGLVMGAAAGSLSGLFVDMYSVGVSSQFLEEVEQNLTPGKYAVVAEIAEGWTTPLDTRMEELGGKVYRSWRIDVEDEQIERDIQATNREFKELKEEWNQATDEAKNKLKAKMDATRDKMKALDDRAKKKAEALKKQAEAKINKLNEQRAKIKEDFKKKLEKTRDELKADYEQRSEKLKKARQLTAEALT
jgi:uncharacterized membrane protein